jgi:hypothetical protein
MQLIDNMKLNNFTTGQSGYKCQNGESRRDLGTIFESLNH